MTSSLPIHQIQQDVLTAWDNGGCIVSAPPGSGKTTALPLWLIENSDETVYLLIPKRIAVKLAADQLASNIGQRVGQAIGIRLKNESNLSKASKIIVTTYGNFLQMLLNNPDDINNTTVILDEFHERSLDQDLTYALINQAVDLFETQVRRIIMSATLNVEKLIQQTGLPLIKSDGFSFPVDQSYEKIDVSKSQQLARRIFRQWQGSENHILVFFPGLKEMRAVERFMDSSVPVLLLHSQLSKTPNLKQLDRSEPQVILSTNIAESSVTLARVHTVIDTGFERFSAINPITSIAELKTRRISQASAIQRSGRAGRIGPGSAIRLWSEEEHNSLTQHQPADITLTDLTQAALQISLWGCQVDDLVWLDPPSTNRWQAAQDKLLLWGAITESGQLTQHGNKMAQSGLEPWLAHLLTTAQQNKHFAASAVLAAHFISNEPIQYDPHEITDVSFLSKQVVRECQQLFKKYSEPFVETVPPIHIPTLIQALTDRLVYWKDSNLGQLYSGTSVKTHDNVAAKSWSLLLEGLKKDSSIYARQMLTLPAGEVLGQLPLTKNVTFNPDTKPQFSEHVSLGKIIVSKSPCRPTEQQKIHAWLTHIEQTGEKSFIWSNDDISLKNRWLLALSDSDTWPKWPTSKQWSNICQPFLSGLSRLQDLPLSQVLDHMLGYKNRQAIDKQYPVYWTSPSGRAVQLKYDVGNNKISADLKLQEMFGQRSQPCVPSGQVIQLNLSAPNGRPVASVTDLPFFWVSTYPEVRKELRGRYAKHPWPEDPLTATATSKTNRQIRNSSGSI